MALPAEPDGLQIIGHLCPVDHDPVVLPLLARLGQIKGKLTQWGTKFSSERIAGCIGEWWQVYTYGHEIWTQTEENLDPNKRYVQVGFKSDSVDTAYVTGKNHFGSIFTLITDKCKNPEMVMKFLNFQATDLGMALPAGA